MLFETLSNLQIPKIGFGTWPIGGQHGPDPEMDGPSLAALHSALALGYTLFDTAEGYAGGHCEELLGRAVRESRAPRENLFITSKVSPEHLQPADLRRSCENSLRRLDTPYIDLYLIHWPRAGMKLAETFQELNQLVRESKVRRLGVSNFELKLLRQAVGLSETPLLTNQVSFSYADRTCMENGVLDYCQQNGILLTAYTPLKRRKIQSDKTLQALAAERGISKQQAALAWLTSRPRVIAIPMSFNPQHQADNLAAGDLTLSAAEMERLA